MLCDQIKEFKPKVAAVQNHEDVATLKEMLAGHYCPEIVSGNEGIDQVASAPEADTVVTGIVGAVGLQPTMSAIKLGKDIALANKETLISGGPVITPLIEKHNVNMLPADSEHSAIFQSLQGCPTGGLRRVVLTASGGAFRDLSKKELFDMCKNSPRDVQAKVRTGMAKSSFLFFQNSPSSQNKTNFEFSNDKNNARAQATTHPNWDMGAKITLDSATMCNKGLEVIEAHYLFGASYDDIDVVVHPQSIVHSMVEMQDTSVIAQLGWADMRLPLVYSISWPHRLTMDYKSLDLAQIGSLTFKAPDFEKYPCIGLCFEAGKMGGTMTSILNAANEAANEIFRKDIGLGFLDIPKLIEVTMSEARENGLYKTDGITLDDILEGDRWARDYVNQHAEKITKEERLSFLA